ncbi:MAG: hypothetical protein J1F01_02940 [Oscillospiraceae bacterium]|nr:hypothetical protein [Oscillospiraceae bacterium]
MAKQETGDNRHINIALDLVQAASDPTVKAIEYLKDIYEKVVKSEQEQSTQMHYQTPGKLDDYIGQGINIVLNFNKQL